MTNGLPVLGGLEQIDGLGFHDQIYTYIYDGPTTVRYTVCFASSEEPVPMKCQYVSHIDRKCSGGSEFLL